MAVLPSCFSPSFGDGELRCGDDGCPPGLVCASDGLCRGSSGAAADNLVLAVTRDGAPPQLLARCDGDLVLAWQLDAAPTGSVVAWGERDDGGRDHRDDGRQLAVGSDGDQLRVFDVFHDQVREAWSYGELHQTRQAAWADYDLDDDLDLGVADGQLLLKVLRQRRDGLEPEWRANDMDAPWGMAWGDLDGDGDLDLAAATTDAVVYRNQGDWFERVWTSPRREERRSVAWLDLDGDGDPELVTGSLAGPLRVHRNDGGALVETWASTETGHAAALDAGDLDGDGDLDLAVAGLDQPSRVYRNDGGGALTLVWSSAVVETTATVEWFDIDGDGDLDLTLGNRADPRVLRNDRGTLHDWFDVGVDRVRGASWARWPLDDGWPSACDVAAWQ